MTACKEAIKDWEAFVATTKDNKEPHADLGKEAAEMEEVRLCPIANMKPLIAKMDNSLSGLKKCKQLRMSSNSIGKIEGLAGCDNLTILSLGRNMLKKIEGLNEVSDTLEQLWISYNQLASLAGVEKLVNLQVLYASNNKLAGWNEVERLQGLPKLKDLNLTNNPLHQKHDAEGDWRVQVIQRLEKLKTLDGSLIDDEEREAVRQRFRPATRCAHARLFHHTNTQRKALHSPHEVPAHSEKHGAHGRPGICVLPRACLEPRLTPLHSLCTRRRRLHDDGRGREWRSATPR